MRTFLLLPWRVVKWTARVALWLVVWPVGLWRSYRHGRQKNNARLVAELRKGSDQC